MLASALVGEALSETAVQPVNVDAASGKPLLAFVHIPRTGGGTVSSAISKNYSPLKGPGNFQRGPEKTQLGLQNIASKPGLWEAVGDHVPYGLFLRYLPADTRYMTILRDPVDRALSHYHFHAQAGDPPGTHGERKLRNMWETALTLEAAEKEGIGDLEKATRVTIEEGAEFSLEEGLRRKIYLYDNFMTRFLWGGESLFGELPPDAVDRAKENISNFFFVGVRERLDESIILLGRKLGVGLMPYYLRHVSQKRPALDETSDELRALVAEHNALDMELYKFARERFEEEAPAPGELDAEVEELRARSVEVTEVAEAARAEKRETNRAARQAKRAEGRASRAQGAANGDVLAALGAIEDRLRAVEEHLAGLDPEFSASTPRGRRRSAGAGGERSAARRERKPRAKGRRGSVGDGTAPEAEAEPLDG